MSDSDETDSLHNSGRNKDNDEQTPGPVTERTPSSEAPFLIALGSVRGGVARESCGTVWGAPNPLMSQKPGVGTSTSSTLAPKTKATTNSYDQKS